MSEPAPTQSPPTPDETEQARRFLGRCLLLDIEVIPSGRITHFGALLGEQRRSGTAATGLELLDGLVQAAACVVGHNIARHDLPLLRRADAGHPILALPVIDTLVLAPIAFPANPYHRLVKDHKLLRETPNDPVADARIAGVVFQDQWHALAGIRDSHPDLFAALAHLLCAPEGGDDRSAAGCQLLFESLLPGAPVPTRDSAMAAIGRWIRRHCGPHAALDPIAFTDRAHREGLAMALAWLRVAGSNSVLPPWVRHRFPRIPAWIRSWRTASCEDPGCDWCQEHHAASSHLKRWFGFAGFRPVPKAPDGTSLQQRIIEAGLRDESLLAILPTSGGKSLCFQLPAVVRYERMGVLTVILSPLQALMKDQVDGFTRRTGSHCAAALHGLLTQPERADVLHRIRMGDVGLVYVSPEQLRNRSFREALATREVGCWVFDEAHCVSKWGHDFRPDYLYAGRFIREFTQHVGGGIPSVACYTATAKQEVRAEIQRHFEKELGLQLRLFEGGVSRDNLAFAVEGTQDHSKLRQVDELLRAHLKPGQPGSAVVFRSRRDYTELTAQGLREQGWQAEHFHAGITPFEKKRIQDAFIEGRIQVICATNAFGMGIDKDDVRLVIHADTPGSLENYLQEAGRAGRDGKDSRCVLLYNEEDCEAQFRLGALSELGRRDIAQLLRGIRKAARGREEVVLTSGELLRDEEVDCRIDPGGMMADTQVRTAIAWLERAGFVERNENCTSVFQARLLVKSLTDAERRIRELGISSPNARLWMAILEKIINAEPDHPLTVDSIALLPEFAQLHQDRPPEAAGPAWVSKRVLMTLDSMVKAGLMKRDTLLTAFVRHKVADHSALRLQRVTRLEKALLDILIQTEPDPDPENTLALSIPLLNQRLLDEGFQTSPHQIRQILNSIAQDGRGYAERQGSLHIVRSTLESMRVRILRGWATLRKTSERRCRAAGLVLDTLMAQVPPDAPVVADLMVEFTFEQLRAALESDLVLRSETPDINSTVERSLLFLHEHAVIELRQGLAIFRSAMTLRVPHQRDGQRYTNSDYEPLASHYRERILQVHVMGEYARRGLERIEDAVEMAAAYFRMGREEFVQRFLPLKAAMREHATTAGSYERIVDDLENPEQIRIVTAPVGRNLLVLAGPGAGKTRTVVHRAAYLLRVHRVRSRSILICCFNRGAAIELRRRLNALVGEDARGVTILTYHSLALRLLGRSLAHRDAQASSREEPDFDSLVEEATALLKGRKLPVGIEADDIRDRLLAGFEYILVDEYQDIDARQYELIAALAGRTLDDPDQKLSILAVGDDDQSIYAFRGANVEFIRRFQSEYGADIHHLVENFRSTRRIIDAANGVIAINHDRMKTGHPIRIDRQRQNSPVGGPLERLDPVTRGRVQCLEVQDALQQAGAVVQELRRLATLNPGPWHRFAVLSSNHRELALVRAVLEREAIPLQWRADRGSWPRFTQLREVHAFLEALRGHPGSALGLDVLREILARLRSIHGADNPWLALVEQVLLAWQDEVGTELTPAAETVRFFQETLGELRREAVVGDGVVLSTVHAAKGTEYDHVFLIGAWEESARGQEERRRTFYVGMTRARLSLTILDQTHVRPSLPGQLISPEIHRRTMPLLPVDPSIRARAYSLLTPADLFLSFPASHPANAPIHRTLGNLRPGATVRLVRTPSDAIRIVTPDGTVIGALSAAAAATWRPRLDSIQQVRVLGFLRRVHGPDDPLLPSGEPPCPSWEVPLLEVVWEENTAGSGRR